MLNYNFNYKVITKLKKYLPDVFSRFVVSSVFSWFKAGMISLVIAVYSDHTSKIVAARFWTSILSLDKPQSD